MAISLTSNTPSRHWAAYAVFVLLYVLLDWASNFQPLYGLNITPWNPDPALGLVLWLRFGRRAALPWFLAILLSEQWVRGMPAGLAWTLLFSVQLVAGYGAIGEVLRAVFSNNEVVNNQARLLTWLRVVVLGLIVNGAVYIGMLWLAGMVPGATYVTATVRFVIGDVVGVVVSMPLIWMMASAEGRQALYGVIRSRESAAFLFLAALLVGGLFQGVIGGDQYRHLYFLFLPVVWAATRHGLAGTSLIAFTLQFGLIGIIRWGKVGMVPFAELQLLWAAIALVGFFIGVMVDEQRQTAEGLKQSLRLAAAGEMAAALAHELNQPITALSAYGKACEHLIARGETGALLADSIAKMVREAGRTAEVVHRLREFFRSGAIHLETTRVSDIFSTVSEQFGAQCAAQQTVLATSGDPGLAVRADRLQIELVLRNLVANAVDAVQTQAERRITVKAERLAGRRLQITVEDSGPGVPGALESRLFTPFVSGKSSGLGLGLALSRAIVEAHGGKLWSEPGARGTFKFILPLG